MTADPTAGRQAADQLEQLVDGCVDVVRREDLEMRLRRSIAESKPLLVKVGFDPSAPDIHLGHVVLLRKMRQFQDLGHRIVFVVGDFTAMIGDPTGRSKTRPQLSREEIAANARTYRAQAARILDDARTEFRHNSEWLEPLGSVGLIRLAAKYNVARMLERRDFRQRFDAGISIAVHEFLYPLAQAYDSVALKADVELGGTDQLFNLNVGRDVMPEYGLEPQIVMTTPLLEGLDGVEKMSKSLGNAVAIEDPPDQMYGKLMSISDELMWTYWRLVGGAPRELVVIAEAALAAGAGPITSDPRVSQEWVLVRNRLQQELASVVELKRGQLDLKHPMKLKGEPAVLERALRLLDTASLHDVFMDLGVKQAHPKEIKAALARRIVRDFHGQEAAAAAEAEFNSVFAKGETPSEVEEATRPLTAEGVWLPKLLAELGLVKSNGEAIRLIAQGGVEVDGERIASRDHRLAAAAPASYLIKVGKRRFVRVRFQA